MCSFGFHTRILTHYIHTDPSTKKKKQKKRTRLHNEWSIRFVAVHTCRFIYVVIFFLIQRIIIKDEKDFKLSQYLIHLL